jgi:hypothetical protein
MRAPAKTASAKRKWSQGIRTVSTFPPPGTFTKPAEEVASIMARKDVSPRGLGSAIKMVQMFINRSGKNLRPGRKRELERAKRILQQRLHEQHDRDR